MLDDLISQLTTHKFELSLPKCELRQCGTANPRVYTGSGFVRQQADGQLVLRMFAIEDLSERERFARLFPDSFTPGVLIPDTAYYNFTATDQSGHTWRAERQSIEEHFAVGIEIHVQLHRLEKVQEIGEPGPTVSQAWFIPGNFELPWHVQTITEERMSVDRFEFEDEAFAWKVHKVDGGLEVQLTVKNPPLEPHDRRFLHALGILIGQILEPLSSYRAGDGQRITRIHTPPSKTPARLSSPMELRLYGQHDAHRFLACCMHRAEQTHPTPSDQLLTLYRFWHRIARAESSNIENSSLVLSVAIEGILKMLFHSEHDADAEFAKHLKSAKSKVDSLDVHERVRAAMVKSLENAALPKPKDTLQRLREQGGLTEVHIKAWSNLRHAGAHGALLEDDNSKFQRHLDGYFCCLDLFYRLVFIAVGYQGQYVDRSLSGWPKSTFPARDATAIN